MSKKIIKSLQAPTAIGPYSQATEVNGMLFISGQIPIKFPTGRFAEGGIKEQTAQVLNNIEAILKEAGYARSDVVKTTCMLSDMGHFKEMNEVYATFFTENHPARSTFAVNELPMNALVEIETTAVKSHHCKTPSP